MSLGPELVVNGGFDDASAWTIDGDWEIAGGVAVCTEFGGVIYQTLPIVAGKIYRVAFDFVKSTDGAPLSSVQLGGNEVVVVLFDVGSYVYNAIAGDGNSSIAFDGSGFISPDSIDIDNVSVKEILPDSGGIAMDMFEEMWER